VTKEELKKEIETEASQAGVSPLEIISAMQTLTADVPGQEDAFGTLSEIKRDYFPEWMRELFGAGFAV
jgi:hypothetical protein